jgi:hypothetical protein
MRRTPGIALCLALAATPLSAQGRLALLGGGVSATVSTASADQVPNKSSRTGFLAGIGVDVRIGKRIAFAPEAMYVQKGVNATDNTHTVSEEIRVNYLEVPLLLRATLSDGTGHPYLLAGGSVAFRLNCKLRFSGLGQDIREDCSDNDSQPESSDYGAMFGAGVRFGRLGVSLRYDLGLKNINRKSVGGDEVKNRALLGVVSFTM